MKNLTQKIYGVLLIGLLGSGCGQTYNSNTEDFNLLPSSFCSNQANTNLCAANEIIQTKCTNCHTSPIHAGWAAYDTDAEWTASGNNRVVAGNPDASTLITKLKNYGGNMPDQAPPLTESEVQTLRDWINGL